MGFIGQLWRKDEQTPVVAAAPAANGDAVLADSNNGQDPQKSSVGGRIVAFKDFIMYSIYGRVSLAGALLAALIALATLVGVTQAERSRTPNKRQDQLLYTPIQPPSYPLAVRSPYLSTWMPGDNVQDLPSASPQFWNGRHLSWGIMARVDGTAYNLLGITDTSNLTNSATVQDARFTSTHSNFTLLAGDVAITLDFFSPVSPLNYLRQSLPFSYLTVSTSTTDRRSVQIYSDIDGSWTGQTDNSTFEYTASGETSIFSISAPDRHAYAELSDQALWGDVIFASRPNSSNVTTQSGASGELRQAFADNGTLTGEHLDWVNGSSIAVSHDLGQVSGEHSVTFAVGYVREQAINYLGNAYTGYYRASYPETNDAVSYFLDDYYNALAESLVLDADVSTKATGVAGTNYSDIVVLSMRQAYGGLDLTIPNDSLDSSEPLAFIKEISSDGNVNTLDVIFPAFPIYYVMNPEYIRLLLEPVMRYLAAGRWPLPYVIHDIGSAYPNATGHDDGIAESMPIEETGNLLIMAYAYKQASGNSTWIDQYMDLFQSYADYLVSHSLNITLQLSTNDAAGPLVNETNLAVKGALGLKAFGLLSGMTNYSDVGDEHAKILYTQGLATDADKTHFTLNYLDHNSTWKLTFNLYPDILLNLSTFPVDAYTMQDTYYPTIRSQAGVALDNRQWWGKTDWNIWAAASNASIETRNMFVNDIWEFVSNGMNSWPFSDRWVVSSQAETGAAPVSVGMEYALRARPTVGGHFALLALKGARYLQW